MRIILSLPLAKRNVQLCLAFDLSFVFELCLKYNNKNIKIRFYYNFIIIKIRIHTDDKF